MKNPVTQFNLRCFDFGGCENDIDIPARYAFQKAFHSLVGNMRKEGRETLFKKDIDECQAIIKGYSIALSNSNAQADKIACLAFEEITNYLNAWEGEESPLVELKFKCGEIVTKTWEGAYLYKETNPRVRSKIKAVLIDENGKIVKQLKLDY